MFHVLPLLKFDPFVLYAAEKRVNPAKQDAPSLKGCVQDVSR